MVYDQPGLGKTLQAAMALTTPAVISCPGYLVDQWCDFLEDQYPQWKVARIHSLLWRQQRQDLLDTPHDIYVVNHEMFASRKEPFKGGKEPKTTDKDYSYNKWLEWQEAKENHKYTAKTISYHWPRVRTLVIDESHHVRNEEASQSKMMASYSEGCDQVFLLTATPQYKDVRDWWHQIRIMDPAGHPSKWTFMTTYTYAGGWQDTLVRVKSHKVADLQALIGKHAIGRTYNEVGLYLPPLIEKVVKVPWHPDLKKHYLELKHYYRTETKDGYDINIDPGAVLHTLRMMTANPEKVDAVKKIVEDVPGDAPVILFCWYRDTAEMLETEFQESPSSIEITGKYSQKERVKRATALDTRVKCVTMASMSEGVDWSAASTVIFFEEDFTPGKIYQALSRVRRHSKEERKDPVIVYYVHVRDSVDEAVHAAVTERNGDARRVLRRALK
jgi:superfamily II DNA or RNA helicase